MKRVLHVLKYPSIAAATCGFFFFAIKIKEAAARPQIVCDQPVYDFGKQPNDQVIQHVFTIRNSGNGTLNITRTMTSCGCTVADISDKRIAPGKSAELTAEFTLKNRVGPQEKEVYVLSNDPKRPRYALTFKGEALPLFEVSPGMVQFGSLLPGETKEKIIDIVFHKPGSTITEIKTHSDQYTTELKTRKEGKSYRLHVTWKGTAPEGPISNVIYVYTSLGPLNVITLQVTGHVVGDLLVSPEQIVLSGNTDSPVTRYAVLQPGRIKEFKILEVLPPAPDITARVIPTENGGVRIQLIGIHPRPELEGKALIIKTDLPSRPEIKIPFTLNVP